MSSIILIAVFLFNLVQITEIFTNADASTSIIVSETVTTTAQQQRFIPVQGQTLRGRIEAAARQGRSTAGQSKFWSAWSFDVRPGVAVDYEWRSKDGKVRANDGWNVSFDNNVETRNLGVFLLYGAGGSAIERVEIYNLDRQRDYSNYPVYWLGKATNDESLNFLESLTDGQQGKRVNDHSVVAIALHDDGRVGGMLKQFVGNSQNNEVRKSAVFWLGQIGGETGFLSDLVANDRENREVRKQGAFAIGVSKDGAALSTLQSLFQSVTDREVKKQLVFAVSVNNNQDEALNFLINMATNERDPEVKKQAIFWLGQKAGDRSLKVLGDTVNSNDADTEVQKQAVFAISQRPKDEAVPLLINIARTHAKAEVRKQAIFWLGQTGDERAVTFFKELLAK